jgi:hypothetical protein
VSITQLRVSKRESRSIGRFGLLGRRDTLIFGEPRDGSEQHSPATSTWVVVHYLEQPGHPISRLLVGAGITAVTNHALP